jgi:hypothetical protein
MNPYWQLKNSLRNKHGRTPEGHFKNIAHQVIWWGQKKLNLFLEPNILFFFFSFRF